ncbi:putative phloem protein [Helianthus annuus]|nr:putative phloem protein [Helianthus annuus]
MVSFAECLDPGPSEIDQCTGRYISRFPSGAYCYKNGSVKTLVKTQFLSPGITYTVNLVFKFIFLNDVGKCHPISLKYKLKGETENSVSHLAYKREDGWYMTELYQFTSDQSIVDLEILFDGYRGSYAIIEVEGIAFWPLEEVVEHKDEKLPISDSDESWEEKLPTDYEDIMNWSMKKVPLTTKKEMYSIICKGFLINDGQEWFSLDKNGRKCHMLSARAAYIKGRKHTHLMSFPESRFGEVAVLKLWTFRILIRIQPELLSSQTTYASYLVYKLPKDQSGFEAPVRVTDREYLDYNHLWYIYLVGPRIPVIRLKANESTNNQLNRPHIKGLPQQRSDGWMEVQIWEFQTICITKMIPISLKFSSCANKPEGLIIQGVEHRPM